VRRIQRLVVATSPDPAAPAAVELAGRALRIGREGAGPDALRIDDREASRLHARVEPFGDGWRVVDCESHNGVHVDGVRVPSAALAPNTIVRIGASLLVFTDDTVRDEDALEQPTPALLGPSIAMCKVRGAIARVGPRDFAVLVRGETGVGKERVAEELHRCSGRRGKLVAINCASLTAGLADSELFGHVAGAFTGATGRSDGVFAEADGGTLFLDEVGELAPDVQAKLLRALASGEVRAVGASAARRVDVRVVAATLRDPTALREDLRARLEGWVLEVPPLRDRREDVLPIAAATLARVRGPELSVAAAETLLLHAWPHNVRGLQQAIAAAAASGAGAPALRREHLPAALVATPSPAPPPPPAASHRDALADAERSRIVDALERCQGNQTRAAELLGMPRRTLVKRLGQYGIRKR
jgi:DNA-binding NtrC family response regulator